MKKSMTSGEHMLRRELEATVARAIRITASAREEARDLYDHEREALVRCSERVIELRSKINRLEHQQKLYATVSREVPMPKHDGRMERPEAKII